MAIQNCENIQKENDKSVSGGFVGGICGDSPANITIENCNNTAKVTCGAGIGGGSSRN